MEQERVVTLDEAERTIRRSFEELSRKSMQLSHLEQLMPAADVSEIDEKDKTVLIHIKNNPGIIKQEVVDAFNNKLGYSRHVIFDILQRLEELNLITIEPDPVNNRSHHLFVNDTEISDLITILKYFEKVYFELIDKTKPFIEGNNITRITPVELVECLIMFYKFTKDRFCDYLWHGKLCTGEIRHRKFGIIYGSLEEMRIKLHQSLVEANFISNNQEMEMIVNYSRSDVLGPENLTFIVCSFEKCGLRKYADPVIDLLWRLFFAKLDLLYLDYRHLLGEGLLNDWRAVVAEEVKKLPYKREKLLRCPPSN